MIRFAKLFLKCGEILVNKKLTLPLRYLQLFGLLPISDRSNYLPVSKTQGSTWNRKYRWNMESCHYTMDNYDIKEQTAFKSADNCCTNFIKSIIPPLTWFVCVPAILLLFLLYIKKYEMKHSWVFAISNHIIYFLFCFELIE